MTTKELMQLIGQTATYRLNGLVFDVTITDSQIAYGKIRVEITPVAGSAFTWVNRDSLGGLEEEPNDNESAASEGHPSV